MAKKPILLPSEDDEQTTFVDWLNLMGLAHFRVPNETYTESWAQKAKNKALGVSSGVPDLFVALPGRGLLGIEMKRRSNYKVSPAQKVWIELLTTIPGVEARVCHGSDEAIAFVEEVLHGVPSKHDA